MKRKQHISLGAPLKFIFGQYLVTLFFLLVMAALIASVILLNSIISDTTPSDDYTSPISAGSIDQATLSRLQALHPSQQSVPSESHPSGRINPFAE